MGKAARWFRSLLGGGGGRKEQQQQRQRDSATAPPPEDRKRWSFARSSRDSAASAAAAGTEGSVRGGGAGGNAAIARAAEAAWLNSVYGADRDQSKHAIAVAAATTAAADAAVAAAQAAVEVVRLTSQGPVFGGGGGGGGRGGGAVLDPRGRAGAAVKIQTAFRGFLAKKALRALKALVKLQALVRGYLVRRQTAATLQSMQALVRAQAAVRAARCRAVPSLPPLHHPPHIRPRFSLQERYVAADDARSEHGSAAAYSSSRRLSASVESSYDRSPKIVEMDTARPRYSSSRASSLRTDAASLTGDDWCSAALSVPASSPLLLPPPRIAVPSSRHFPDHDWCPPEKPRPATAQCTPRYFAPPTPAKSVCGGGAGPPNGYPASPSCPGYMSSTQSSEAKTRSQSAPKQRPLLDQPAAGGAARKRVPLSEVVLLEARASLSGVAVAHKPPCAGRAAAQQEDAFDFRAAVLSRFEQRASDANAERRRDRDAFLLRRW